MTTCQAAKAWLQSGTSRISRKHLQHNVCLTLQVLKSAAQYLGYKALHERACLQVEVSMKLTSVFLVQGPQQYMLSMHSSGMDPRGMQSMYNSPAQAVPGHMHSHSHAYSNHHHGMMGQVSAALNFASWP